ncbi:efflux RND transporter periplasmic adaptor subunit [Nostoc sp.]|uniref:efflux RND transporter periplasmic adaptor subunit n=1 Tax=Nostoc sp. TaxID=1180 RepID=UPI002FF8D626
MSAKFIRISHPLLNAVFLTALLLSACGKKDPAATAKGPPSAAVKLQTVGTATLKESAEFVGTLEAEERITLQPQIQGRIERILVANGDRVKQGTLIATLSADQTQANVASAKSKTNSARSAVVTAQAQLQASKADQVSTESDVKLQQIQFNRTKGLVSEGAQARQQLDIARNNLETAQAQLDAAKKKVNADEAAVAQAQANVQQAQADTASTSVNLNYKQVLAPISGIVGDFSVKVGDYLNTGQTITTITCNDAFDMRISVPSNYAAQLRRGLTVNLIDPKTNKPLGTGNLYFISPQVNTDAQAILAKARFPNQGGRLRDGQYVRARIIWRTSPGILISTAAVSQVGAQDFVFVAQSESKDGKTVQVARQRPVKLGVIQDQTYQVISGIKAGEQLIVSGIQSLVDGAPIQPDNANRPIPLPAKLADHDHSCPCHSCIFDWRDGVRFCLRVYPQPVDLVWGDSRHWSGRG